MTGLDFTKDARRRQRQKAKKRAGKKRTIKVHPNSTAARIMGRKTWSTTSG